MFIMFGISSFAWMGQIPWKDWRITELTVTYNYLLDSHVLDPQAGPITQVRPVPRDYFFKELVLITAIKWLQWTVLAALAGNQIHLCAKGRVSSTRSAETFVGQPPALLLSSFRPPSDMMRHYFGSEEPTHCEPIKSMKVQSLVSDGSRKWTVSKIPGFDNYMAHDSSQSQLSPISEGIILSERKKQTFWKKNFKLKKSYILPLEQKEKPKNSEAINLEFSILEQY